MYFYHIPIVLLGKGVSMKVLSYRDVWYLLPSATSLDQSIRRAFLDSLLSLTLNPKPVISSISIPAQANKCKPLAYGLQRLAKPTSRRAAGKYTGFVDAYLEVRGTQ